MKLEETGHELIIRETPAGMWLVGLFFAAIGGMFVYGALGGFSNWNEVPSWQLKLAFAMGMAGVGTGFWIIASAPVLRLTIDRLSERVEIRRFGLTGRKSKTFTFNDIEHFFLLSGADSEGDQTWTFSLALANGDFETIAALPLHSDDFERRFVFAANEFMNKQLPATEMVFLDDDE